MTDFQAPQPALQLGDTIIVNVRQPHPAAIRMTLATPESLAYANELLADPESGWRFESQAAAVPDDFQARVSPWLHACFGPEIARDPVERNHRFLEEALELVQSLGCTQSEAHQLVDYVFGRLLGDPSQEVGGVMVTLAALCLANGLDMHEDGETELTRIWTMVEKIRAKQAAKPKHSPLPVAAIPAPEGAPVTPDANKDFGDPRRAMDETELQEFCIALSFEQDDYTTEVIRAVETRMLAKPLFFPADQSPAEVDENAIAMAWNTVRAEARALTRNGGGGHSLSDLLTAVEQYGDRRAALANVQPKGTKPDAWKCANCGAVSEVSGTTPDDNWCSSCAACGRMEPRFAAAQAPAPAHSATLPVKPTEQMIAAGAYCLATSRANLGQQAQACWEAMFKVAPSLAVAPDEVRDAARYRWLRKQSETWRVSIKINGDFEMLETLDDAVDTAMGVSKPPQAGLNVPVQPTGGV